MTISNVHFRSFTKDTSIGLVQMSQEVMSIQDLCGVQLMLMKMENSITLDIASQQFVPHQVREPSNKSLRACSTGFFFSKRISCFDSPNHSVCRLSLNVTCNVHGTIDCTSTHCNCREGYMGNLCQFCDTSKRALCMAIDEVMDVGEVDVISGEGVHCSCKY